MATLVEARIPDIGDFKDVEVIDVAVRPGDTVAVEATLVTLETEKATMDVPAVVAGVVRELRVQRGSRVSEGDVVAIIEAQAPVQSAAAGAVAVPAQQPSPVAEASPAASLPTSQPVPVAAAVQPAARPAAAAAGGFSTAHASPSVRRFARELGVDLALVSGTGTKGRITEQDVKAHVKRRLTEGPVASGPALPRVPVVDFAAFGPVERRPLSRIQRIAGPRLHASWVNVPHVTQFDEADITALEQARARLKDDARLRGARLTPLAFVMRACVQALQAFPHFGASLDVDAGEQQHPVLLVQQRRGFPAALENGVRRTIATHDVNCCAHRATSVKVLANGRPDAYSSSCSIRRASRGFT